MGDLRDGPKFKVIVRTAKARDDKIGSNESNVGGVPTAYHTPAADPMTPGAATNCSDAPWTPAPPGGPSVAPADEAQASRTVIQQGAPVVIVKTEVASSSTATVQGPRSAPALRRAPQGSAAKRRYVGALVAAAIILTSRLAGPEPLVPVPPRGSAIFTVRSAVISGPARVAVVLENQEIMHVPLGTPVELACTAETMTITFTLFGVNAHGPWRTRPEVVELACHTPLTIWSKSLPKPGP